jgi:ABC-2 type transport system permease protein
VGVKEVTVPRWLEILRKDLRLGPRSPILLWALVVPLLMTLLVRGVFGGLFDDDPRVGVVDLGGSALVAALDTAVGIDVRRVADGETLREEVSAGGLDAGLMLPAGFDDAVRAGAQPPLPLWVSGRSLQSERALVIVTVLDLVRGLSGAVASVEVEVIELGEAGLGLELRLLPLLVLYAVAIPGGMIPAASLVQEKEQGTLPAVMASPASIGDVLLAKGLLGVILATLAGVVTLALNDAFGGQAVALLLAIVLGAVMMALVGLLLGAWAPDTNTLFAAWKGGGIVLFLPAVFFVWPNLPTWPAQLVPTYYFLQPAFAVSVEGASLADVGGSLLIGAVLCVALLPLVRVAGRRMERRLAGGRGRAEPVPELADA